MDVDILETQSESVSRRVATGLGKIGLAIKSRAWKRTVSAALRHYRLKR